MTGKGSAPRPLSVSEEEFRENFDRIDWSAHRTSLTGIVDADLASRAFGAREEEE